MNRHHSATLETPAYDSCLISSCLKSLFTKTAKTKTPQPDFTISSRISEVRKELEQLNKESVLELSYAYLSAMEASTAESGFRYAVIYRNDKPVLLGYFQLFTLTSKNFNLKENESFVKGIFSFFLDLKKAKVLIAGNGVRNETPCCCYDDALLSKHEATEVLVSVAEKIAADENASAVILKDVPVSAHTKKWLAQISYHTPWEDKVMVMEVNKKWENLADYVGDLSRKYKTRANKILACAEGITTRVLTEAETMHHQKDINRLFTNVINNQEFILTHPGAEHFIKLKKLYGDAFEVTGFYHGSKMVAFSTAFVTDDSYEIYYIGLDYHINNDHQLYFNMLFSGLERAILNKKKLLKLGRTSFDAKASLGAKPVDVDYFVKTSGIPDIVRRKFVKYFSAMEDTRWKQRNPLKNA